MRVSTLAGLHFDEKLERGIWGRFISGLQVIDILMHDPQKNGAGQCHIVPVVTEFKKVDDVIKGSNQQLGWCLCDRNGINSKISRLIIFSYEFDKR